MNFKNEHYSNDGNEFYDFKNFDLITPNEKEARFSLGDQDSSISTLTRELYKKSNCKKCEKFSFRIFHDHWILKKNWI